MSERKFDSLFLLVGSNPLPNYLAALVLRPRAVTLFYSPKTEKVKNLLRQKLTTALTNVNVKETCIDDATDAAKVRAAFKSIPAGTHHLHYTGGTKIMAAHARMAFRDAGGTDQQASYLDEPKGLLRFDDGDHRNLSEQQLGLTVDDFLALQEITRRKPGPPPVDSPTEDDAARIARAVLPDPGLAEKLHAVHRNESNKRVKLKKAKGVPVSLDELVPGLNHRIPEACWNDKTYEKWWDFLGGEWMDVWCGALLRQLVDGGEIIVDLNCTLVNGRKCQIDVALVRSHRLYVVSCTTDTSLGICKSKLFEVAMRARQLGGDLARSALVCLLHGSDSNGAYVDQLRNDVADVWKAPNTPRVFGHDNLMEWLGVNSPPNLNSLRNWLDS
ncbi:MAG: hypothetical protein GXX84_09560 [Acidobacteria bacterium]|nr:hypothetical protein [Acidobacteriota bacterium]